ncbi:MAG TPA: hypothetical protein VN515_04690 [Terriglobales bacterium]|nr:hypothetical protein [Terriglobales bacterium]
MDDATREPIPMPSPRGEEPGWRPAVEHVSRMLGRGVRQVRAEADRLRELVRAARTHEGRERNLAPLLVLTASCAFLVGLGLGWRRR